MFRNFSTSAVFTKNLYRLVHQFVSLSQVNVVIVINIMIIISTTVMNIINHYGNFQIKCNNNFPQKNLEIPDNRSMRCY
jgi:hypothetical protein